MKSQSYCIIFELSRRELNGKLTTLKYPLPIDSDIETHFNNFLEQLRKDGVHLRNNDLKRIASDYANAITVALKEGRIRFKQPDFFVYP